MLIIHMVRKLQICVRVCTPCRKKNYNSKRLFDRSDRDIAATTSYRSCEAFQAALSAAALEPVPSQLHLRGRADTQLLNSDTINPIPYKPRRGRRLYTHAC